MQVSQQDYHYNVIRTSAVLTNDYVASTVIKCATDTTTTAVGFPEPSLRNQLVLYVPFTIGLLTSMNLKIEFSHDGTLYAQETVQSVAVGVITETAAVHNHTATAIYRIAVPIKDRFIKVSLQGVGVVTDSLAAVHAIVGVA